MNPWIELLGWTLIHFLWQGAVVGAAAAAALRVCRRRSAQCQYAIACAGLAVMLGSTAITATLLGVSGASRPSGYEGPAFVRELNGAAGPLAIAAEGVPTFADRTRTVRTTLSSIMPAIVWLWLTGVTALLTRFSVGCWRVHRLRVKAMARPTSVWQQAGETLAQRLGVEAVFRVIESRLVDAPTVIGCLQPIVLLPVSMLSSMPPRQIEALIAHELAHIRRRDYAINLLQTVAEALLFFHPAVWWISSRIREEREHCCDDAAIGICGEAASYAEALAALAAGRLRHAPLPVGAASGPLLTRIQRLIDPPQDVQPPSISAIAATAAAAAFAVGVLVVPTSPAAAQPEARNVRQSDHFEIHYAAALDLHAERIAQEAERAYERLSGDLGHSLASKVAIVLFESDAERDRGARDSATGDPAPRVLLAVDRPADQWFGLLTHELTHVFSFDIIPGTRTPRWITEGLAEYERGAWDPADLVRLRQAVRTNDVPALASVSQGAADGAPGVEALGHAAFDFIESRWGKSGIRQFLLALRQSARVTGDPYVAAFHVSDNEFNDGFDRYLRTRFSGARQADRFDHAATRRVEGSIIALRYPAPPGLACIELSVPAGGETLRWGIECGNAPAEDVIRALKPGDRVIITGSPARQPELRRLLMAELSRAEGAALR